MLYETKSRVLNNKMPIEYAEHRSYQIWHDIGFLDADTIEEYNILVKAIERHELGDTPPL